MNIDLLAGWRKAQDFRGDECYLNNDRQMLICTSHTKSTLVKENEVYLEFTGKEHFSDALKKCDEIWAEKYAHAH